MDGSEDSVYMTTSVFLPDAGLATLKDLSSVERVTRRADRSAVLAIGATVIEVNAGPEPTSLAPAWQLTSERLTRGSITSAWLHERQALLNVRLALWKAKGSLQVLMPSSMLSSLSALTADVYLNVSRSEDETASLEETPQSDIEIQFADSTPHAERPPIATLQPARRIREQNASLRQRLFEEIMNQLNEDQSGLVSRTASSPATSSRLIISFSGGSSGSGIVLPGSVISGLVSRSTTVMLRTV